MAMIDLAIGLFRPVSINIFGAQSVLRIDLKTIRRGIPAFVVLPVVALVLATYVPALSLVAAGCS